MEKIYGYIRVSSSEQNIARQLAAMKSVPVTEECLYIDRISGKDFKRPAYRKLMDGLCPGDVVFVLSIDRLGRNYHEIIEEWRRITQEKQAHIVVMDMPLLDTRAGGKTLMGTFISDLVLQILSFVAENERDSIRKRQEAGIREARRKGVKFGRPAHPLPENFLREKERWLRGRTTLREAASACHMPVSTFYSKVKGRK